LTLRLDQLGVFLDQLFQTESMKLYRNLGVFPIAFAMIDHSFAIFGVVDAVSLAQSAPSGALVEVHLRAGKLFAARGEKVGDVVDGIVGRAGVGGLGRRAAAPRVAAPP